MTTGFNDEALVPLPTAPTLIRWFGMLTSSRPLAITPVERLNYVDCLLFSCEVPDDTRPLDDSTVLTRGDYACCYASPTGGESFRRRKPDVLTLDASSWFWRDFQHPRFFLLRLLQSPRNTPSPIGGHCGFSGTDVSDRCRRSGSGVPRLNCVSCKCLVLLSQY